MKPEALSLTLEPMLMMCNDKRTYEIHATR